MLAISCMFAVAWWRPTYELARNSISLTYSDLVSNPYLQFGRQIVQSRVRRLAWRGRRLAISRSESAALRASALAGRR